MEEPLGRAVAYTGKVVSERFDAYLNQHDSSVPTWLVLKHVGNEDGLSQRELAGRIGIEGPTLVRHLDRMEAEGLVARRRDDHDRRIVRISLTTNGRRRHAHLIEVVSKLDAQLRALLTEREVQVLERALRRIREEWFPEATPERSMHVRAGR